MNEVERIYEELKAIGQIGVASNDVSARTDFGAHSAKTLLLVGASNFERRIASSIEDHLNNVTTSSVIRHFAFNQAVKQKFFSLFDFNADTKNIKAFLSKFGPDYSNWAKDDMKAAGVDIGNQIAFLNLCRLRNSLVHNNYATYDIIKTLDEVWAEFDKAALLVRWIESSFERFNKVVIAAGAERDGQTTA